MKQKPTWAKNMSRVQLYDACWMMGNCVKIDNIIKENPFYSLLPIRFYNFGDWNYSEKYDLHSVGHYENGYELCKTSDICSSKAYFAQKLWELGAIRTLENYPDLENVAFESQSDDGIYPIRFRYNIDELTVRQRQIMLDIIDEGFTVDEYLKIEYSKEEGRKNWFYKGVVGYSYYDLFDIFYNTPYGESIPINYRKNVSYSYEECEEYYKTFDAHMLILGNQRRAYQYFSPENKELFEAAKSGSRETLAKLISKGYSLNEIDPMGDTAFSIFLNHLIPGDDVSNNDLLFLESIIEHNVNINLIGVTAEASPPVFKAFVYNNNRLFQWLIDKGADLNAQIHYDSNYDLDYSHTIADWIESHSE